MTEDVDGRSGLRPNRAVRWEHTADGRVVLIVPKLRARLLAKYILPRLQRAEYRVRLDVLGSHVWDLCDGTRTVLDLAASVWVRFGGDRESINERVAEIVMQLERNGYVTMEHGDASTAPARG